MKWTDYIASDLKLTLVICSEMSVALFPTVTLPCLFLKSHRIPALLTGLICLGSVWGSLRPLKGIVKGKLEVNV